MMPRILISGIIRSLFQFTYTSLFGFFVAFVFLRTGNIYACIVAHTFCNWMGLPRFWGRVGQLVEHELAPVATSKETDSKDDSDEGAPERVRETSAAGLFAHSHGMGWTVAYYTLLGLGASGFYMLLWPLTESNQALVSF